MQFVEANGAKIPAIGLGTWELRGRTCARIVEQALRLGYRHIDTAQAYENEREVGDGLRASGVRRDDVFVTTKVWTTHFAPHDLERSAKESLVQLRMPEVDLLLLHWLVQQGVIPIPRTAKVERLQENLAVFDFVLSPAEMSEIAGLRQPNGRVVNPAHAPKWDD